MKIVGSKKAVRTPQFHQRQERIRKLKITLWTLLILLVVTGPFLLLRNKHLLIASTKFVGNSVTTNDDLQQVINQDLSGSYFHLVPRASDIFYPKNKIEQDILDTFPRISSVRVSLSGPSSLAVTVAERQPAALYCMDVTNPAIPSGCYFLDNTGYIFALAPVFSSAVYNIYTSNSTPSPLKTQFFTPADFKNLQNFLGSLGNIPLAPAVLAVTQDEYDLTLTNGTEVMWLKSQNLDTIYSSLDSFILDPSIRKQGVNNLIYIDLRVDDKVFYKFQGE